MYKKMMRHMTLITYLIMIFINGLSIILPINNIGIDEISELYDNLFIPAGFTFSIWGLIYILLGVYIVFQYKNMNSKNESIITSVNKRFILTSIANVLWILCWHYDKILLSFFLMIIILMCLGSVIISLNREHVSKRENWFITLPFSVYFGWITVATITNATALFISIGVEGFSPIAPVITILIIIIGLIIGLITTYKFKLMGYGIVIIWAYLGILIRHISKMGFNALYPEVIVATVVSIIIMIGLETVLLISVIKEMKNDVE
ncbi:MAG: tryptophan-rich sensory protein [Clostridiales bacterium]|nr:tryptophan-rich sensory protein [Clostridiales bacterium]